MNLQDVSRMVAGDHVVFEGLDRNLQGIILILYANNVAFTKEGLTSRLCTPEEVQRAFFVHHLSSMPEAEFRNLKTQLVSSSSSCVNFMFEKGIIDNQIIQ